MAYSLSPWLKPRFFITGTNRPLAGGLMYTYKAGTTDPATTYSDDAGTTNTNPIQLDSDGQCDLFLDDAVSYRIILKNSAGVTQFDKDRIASLGSTQVQSFNSIAALRLKTGTTIANSAKTLGYWTAGDGGENYFYWDGTSTATDNGGTVIKPTSVSGAGRWLATNSDVVYVKQFGAKGDGTTDDTTAIVSAIAASISSVIFHPGVYVHAALTISKKTMFAGINGTKAGATVRPRLFLKSGTNADGITITTTGSLYAERIDFWGNKAGQSGASNVITLTEDTSGSYVGANSLFFTDCIIRNGYTKGINCNKNRNGGLLDNCFILENDEIGFNLLGLDWYCVTSQFGLSGGNNLYTDFGASNDFVCCDFYFSGKNASYGGNKSNIYIGTSVNTITISACQINSGYHHGIECAESIAGGQYVFTSNQFGANGVAAVDTYSNIKIGFNRAAIKGNIHWNVGQKPKYLIETSGTAVRVDFDDVYPTDAYVTAVTNDETKLFNRSARDGIVLGDAGTFISRTSTNDKRLKFFLNTDANEKFSIDNNGAMRWGAGGASATDTSLFRNTSNVLEIGADDCFRVGRNTTANRPSAVTVASGSQFYDTTLSKPIWSDGAVWRDAAGTAV